MKKKILFIFLILFEICLWVICIKFALFFYQGHQRYPDDWIPLFGMLVMLGIGMAFSLFFLIGWKTFQKNQVEFNQNRTRPEMDLPHSGLDFSLPLALQDNILKINRGWQIETIPLDQIFWLHCYRNSESYSRGSGYHLHLYLKSGQHIHAIFNGGNAAGVLSILRKIETIKPEILISEGYHSRQYKEYKKAYKAR